MDNGNKIKINRPEVKLFLHGDLLPANIQAPVKYNLTEEYAKTRSKKISFSVIALIICVFAVTVLTIGLVRFLQERNNSLAVDINVFDDLNLKNLLDVVSRTQGSLDQASQEKSQLELELSTKLSQAELKRDSDMQLLNSLNMSDEERRLERNIIFQEYENSVAQLNAEYFPQIDVLERQMQDYTNQLASFDSSNVELAQQQEAAINSQRQAFELEKQELIENYDKLIADLVLELETLQAMQLETQAHALSALSDQHEEELTIFDPLFVDERANAIVSQFQSPEEAGEVFAENGFEFSFTDETVQNRFDTMLLETDIEFSDFNYVSGIASSVPWSNSLEEYLQSLRTMANNIGNDIVSSSMEIFAAQEAVVQERTAALALQEEALTQALLEKDAALLQQGTLQEQFNALQVEFAFVQERMAKYEEEMLAHEEMVLAYEEQIEGYEAVEAALDVRARQSGDAGYILSVDDIENMRVYISPMFAEIVQDGTRAFVFREGNLVGIVSLYRKKNHFYANADEGTEDTLRVNDVLLLELIQ